jgi:hypothetical protein
MAPLVALLHDRCWALPARIPDPAQDGHKPDAVLVGGPQRYLRLRGSLL